MIERTVTVTRPNGETKEIKVDWEKMPCYKCEWRYSIFCPKCDWNRDGHCNVY